MEKDSVTLLELQAVLEDMNYIISVNPDYRYGRRKGLTDSETEMLAEKALRRAENVIERIIEEKRDV